jgi:hypothetical protein
MSQRALKDLAAEPIAEEALAAVRTRIAWARVSPPTRPSAAWAWAAAAGLAAVATAAIWWLATSEVVAPPAPEARTSPVARPAARPAPQPPAVAAASSRSRQRAAALPHRPRQQSTVPAVRPVSPDVESQAPTPALSSEDADQLARALVALSRVDHLGDASPEPPPAEVAEPLMRLETADPSIVIYWRLDSNGGE